MRTGPSAAVASVPRPAWRAAVLALAVLGSLCLAGVAHLPSARAAGTSVAQCNGQGPGAMGATTAMTCAVTIVNTISGATRGSTTTLTRNCSLDPCAPGNGTFTTTSTSLVSAVDQCNNSDNDAAHPVTCTVTITNNISAGTPGATPVTPATLNQCVGSAGGGGGTVSCLPFPATTTGATVTQCNGSGNGGGGTVACTVGPPFTVSPAVPLSVHQCNGTGNAGSVVTCHTTITTNIVPVAAGPTATASPTASAGPTHTASPRPTASPTPSTGSGNGADGAGSGTAAGAPQVARVPAGGVQAGGGSTAGLQHTGLLALGGSLLLGAAFLALIGRRVQRTS